MTLIEALGILNKSADPSATPERVYLACGFTPLHFQSFPGAYLKQRLNGRPVEIVSGLYGDLPGNIERAARERISVAAIVEWSDLDPRLGIRHSAGWGTAILADIVMSVDAALRRLEALVVAAAASAPVALCGPTLPLPPVGHTTTAQADTTALRLNELLSAFLVRCAGARGVRVVNARRLDEISPPAERLDVKMELFAGFPYRHGHTDALARTVVDTLYPLAPKKGLIVDLDNTLWSGIVGEIGAENVSWDHARKAQVHGLLQQAVAALADSGVLVGVASKNDPAVAGEALRRDDMLIRESSLYPIEVNWGPKSASVSRILKTWNIAADAVVFVDDSPMELAEVQAAYPEIQCLTFTPSDPDRVWQLLFLLKDLFGKPSVGEEDRLRSGSLRAAAELESAKEGGEVAPQFLESLGATVTLDYRKDLSDERAFELVNKTNQFNLNGRRFTESDWRESLEKPSAFLVRVSYQDKFGPLGKIGVLTGSCDGKTVVVDSWVMSCRAFSRRIEHHTLERLFTRFDASEVKLNFRKTDRNMPLQEFLDALEVSGGPAPVIEAGQFRERCNQLPHKVTEIDG